MLRAQLLLTTILACGTLAVMTPSAGAQAIPNILSGNGGTGFVVSSDTALQSANSTVVLGPTVTLGNTSTQTVFTNYATVGGTGSGGGGGLGGVFFVDNGGTLTLKNVSFNNNSATGGFGGGVPVQSVASTVFSISPATVNASAIEQIQPTYTGTFDSSGYEVSSVTLAKPTQLIGVGSGVAGPSGGYYASSVSSVTTNTDGTETVNFNKPLTLSSGDGIDKATSGGFYFSLDDNSASAVQKGMPVVGDSIPTGAVVGTITYDDAGKVRTFKVVDSHGQDIALSTGQQFAVLNGLGLNFSRFVVPDANLGQSTTLVTNAPLAGFGVGMNVVGAGALPGTIITNVTHSLDPTTGNTVFTVTFNKPVQLALATTLEASYNPLASADGTVLDLQTITGLAAGQTLTGIGIADGTKIVSIAPDATATGYLVTLSKPLGGAAVNQIDNQGLLVSVDGVTSSVAGTSVTLTSVVGYKVGDIITGDPSIPANAVITSINATTKTISYAVNASASNNGVGGSMNNLASAGTPGLPGVNGIPGSNWGNQLDAGEGLQGTNASAGTNGSQAIGGAGGNGGAGSNGGNVNPSLIVAVTGDTLNVLSAILGLGGDYAGTPFTLGKAVQDLSALGSSILGLVYNTVQLATWQVAESQGLVAGGGNGGNGGGGGSGDDFFGGGPGGNGGNGGLAGAPSVGIGGTGGTGGSGGAGGFGAGGGSGGAAGVSGTNGAGGSNGSAGAAGFGGGTGSVNGASGQGGSGYGGAIFVRNGGTLNITGNAIFQNNAALAGSSTNGGLSGQSAGNDLFIMTGATVNLTPGTGNTITFRDSIADDSSASIGGASNAAGQGASIHIGGGGTVQFFGTDTYSGTTYISGATLEAQDGTGISSFSHVVFDGVGTIGANLNTTTAGVWLTGGTITRPVGLQPNNISWTDGSGNSGSGGFAATAGGLTVNLGSINGGVGPTLTWNQGGFVPAGGTLIFGSDATDATGTVTFLNSINLNSQLGQVAVFHNAGSSTNGITTFDATLAGAVTGGTLRVNDTGYTGSLLMSAMNSLFGVTLNAGVLSTTNGTVTGRLMDPNFGGFLTINGGHVILGGAERLTTLTVAGNGGLVALGAITSGDIVNAGAIVFGSTLNATSITNSGLLTLSNGAQVFGAFNNQSSGTVVQSGNLMLVSGNVTNGGVWNLAGNIGTPGTVENDGTLNVIGTLSGTPAVETAATRTITTSGFSGSAGAIVNLGGISGQVVNTLVISQSGGSTFSGVFTGAGGLTMTGSGALYLTGTNTYTGATVIQSGASLWLWNNGSVAASSGVQDDGNFDISLTNNGAAIQTLSGGGTVGLGNKNLTITNGSTTFGGVIGGTGAFKITGGTETLTGTNTYTGWTIIDAGDPPTLVLSGTGSIALSAGVVDNSVFDISATTAGASITTLTGNGSVLLGAQTLTLTNANHIFTGVISGSGGLTLTGGNEGLTGVNTYTGNTTINAGTGLYLITGGSIAGSQNVIDNGLFDISSTTSGASIVTLSGSGVVNLGSKTLTLSNASTTFAGGIGGTGGLTVAAGSETLSGSNTYTGMTTIVSGAKLLLTGTGSIAASSEVADAGTFDISGTTSGASIVTLSGAGSVALGAQRLTLSNASTTFSGVIGGTGGFTVAAGTETLTGVDTYTGSTVINTGAVLILTGSGSVTKSSAVTANGIFDISNAGASIVSLDGSGQVKLGSKTINLTGAYGTFGGVISGTGMVHVAAGTETFSGGNTYTGSTTVDSGATLALAGGGSISTSSGVVDNGIFNISATTAGALIKTLSGSGSVALGTKTLALTAAADTFSGVIGGTGALSITGTEVLTGANTYSGGTTITSGAMLKVNGNAALGAAGGSLTINNGTLQTTGSLTATRATTITGTATIDTNSQAVTMNGVIGGTGNLTTTGGGTLTLTGTNTYSGGTTINGATTVNVCSDANLGSASGSLVINSGTLVTTCSFTSSRTITLNGTNSRINSNGNPLNLGGTITLNPGTGPITLYTGTVHTTGAWTLDTVNGLYVSGTLGGVGTVAFNTTVGGTISPGNSPGTLTFTAPLTLTSSSTTLIEVDGTGTGTGAGNFDRIVATGAGNTVTVGGTLVVALRGITGSANNTFTPVLGQRFNVIATDAGVLGSYASLTEPTSGLAAGTQFDTIYSSTTMDLVATPTSYANLTAAGLTDTRNRINLGHAIDGYRLAPGVRMTGDRNTVLGALYSLPGAPIAPAMNQIAGAVYADALNTAQSLDTMFASAAEDHTVGGDGVMVNLSANRRNGVTAMNEAPAETDSVKGPFWARGLGQWSTTATDGNAPAYHSSAGGLIVGMDIPVRSFAKLGASFGYAHANIATTNGATATLNTERLSVYAGAISGDFRFDGEVGGAMVQYDANRLIQIGSLTRTATGSTTGFNVSIDATTHYGDGLAQPFLQVRFDHVGRSSFGEANAGDLSLNLRDNAVDNARTMLGIDLKTGGESYGFGARLAWAHDFAPSATATDAALSGSPSGVYTVYSSQTGREAAVVKLSLLAKLDAAINGYIEYGGEVRERQTTQTAALGLRWTW